MQCSDQYAPANTMLRLEDIGRRLACDRCRRMKTRCERPQHQDIAQLQQCRRCRQAQKNCITTIEAQPDAHDPSDKASQRAGKRLRPPSSDSDGRFHPTASADAFEEKQQDILQDVFSPHQVAENPSLCIPPGGPDFNYDLLLRHDTAQPWLEFGHDFGLEEGVIPSTLPTPYAALSLDDTPAIEQPTQSPTMILEASNPAESTLDLTAHDKHSSRNDTPAPQAPKPVTQSIMAALMSFNHALSTDLQAHTTHTHLLTATLGHTTSFLSILHTLHEPSTAAQLRPRSPRIDIDIALQLLSCHTNLVSLHDRLCSSLHTHDFRLPDDANVLSSLRLDGLASLCADSRATVLLQICGVAYAEVAERLDSIRTGGLLTQTAARTFESVLGGSIRGRGRSGEGLERAVAELRRTLGDKG